MTTELAGGAISGNGDARGGCDPQQIGANLAPEPGAAPGAVLQRYATSPHPTDSAGRGR